MIFKANVTPMRQPRRIQTSSKPTIRPTDHFMMNLEHSTSRRTFLGGSSSALGALALSTMQGDVAQASELGLPHHPPKARRVIYLFMSGGPSHIDLWDLKPDAPDEIRGSFKSVSTNVPGIQICEHYNQLSKHVDKLANR